MTTMLSAFIPRAPLAGLLGLRSGHTQPKGRDDVKKQTMNFLVGDYMVTPDGKLLKKVRRRRPKLREEIVEDPEIRSESSVEGSIDSSDESAQEERARDVEVAEAAVEVSGHDFKNALVIIPPESLQAPIQAIRAVHDPAYSRWMPHINIIWPFAKHSDHKKCAKAMARALAGFKPFEIRFESIKPMVRGGKAVCYLEPTTPSNELQDLHEVLRETFPSIPSTHDEFLPHLTVAKTAAHQASKLIAGFAWKPIKFEVKEVYLITRTDDTPFRVTETIRLGQ